MPHGKFMEKLNKADKLLRQFPHGIRAVDFAGKIGVSRTQVYEYLNSLESQGKARNEHGFWFSKGEKGPSRKEACSGYIQPKLSEKERTLLLLDVECYALREEMEMDADEYNSEAPEERAKRRQKYRELFKLS